MEERNIILYFLKNNKDEMHRQFGVCKIGLFGSAARGEIKKNSDIDIVIELDEEYKTLKNFMMLEEFLRLNLKRRIDLGVESSIKPGIKKNIEKDIIYV
jgi:uncharacterized protein